MRNHYFLLVTKQIMRNHYFLLIIRQTDHEKPLLPIDNPVPSYAEQVLNKKHEKPLLPINNQTNRS